MARHIALLGAATLLAVSAAGAAQSSRPKHYYLALGDSQAYGVQPTKIGRPPAAFNTGYVDLFAARLRGTNPKFELVNYSCPGESTRTFARGGCPWLAEGRKLHDPFGGSQLDAAIAFLKAHRGQVSPITITLWGNDVVPPFDTCGKRLVACVRARSAQVIAAFEARLGPILHRLRAAAPGAVILVTGPWNFDEEHPELTTPLFGPLDAAMRRRAAAVNARFVDLLTAFNSGSPAAAKARLCAWTYICSGDPHPTDLGYRMIARAVERAWARD